MFSRERQEIYKERKAGRAQKSEVQNAEKGSMEQRARRKDQSSKSRNRRPKSQNECELTEARLMRKKKEEKRILSSAGARSYAFASYFVCASFWVPVRLCQCLSPSFSTPWQTPVVPVQLQRGYCDKSVWQDHIKWLDNGWE